MKEFWLMLTPWKKFKLIFSTLIAIFIISFAIINWQETEINFIFFKLKISITLLIIVCLLAGYLSSSLFDYRKYKIKEREILRLKDKIKALESEQKTAE